MLFQNKKQTTVSLKNETVFLCLFFNVLLSYNNIKKARNVYKIFTTKVCLINFKQPYMKAIGNSNFEKKKHFSYYIITILFLFSFKVSAQNDTIFFDKDWKESNKIKASYYRIKPLKIKTKDAVGYKIKNIDSLFTITDYYLKNNKIQFQGYSQDYYGDYLVGEAKWYGENENTIAVREFNYKENCCEPKFKFPEWPIFYLNYSIADKSILTTGLEFCLECRDKNKLFFGAGYGITNSYNGKYYGLPDIHLSYNTENFLFVKAGSSSKNAYVVSGLTLLNSIDLGFGYSFPYNKEKIPTYQGFTTSITFRISKNKNVYTDLKIM